MQGFPKTIATRKDLENLLADDAYRPQALAHLQLLLDEQYGYDDAGVWALVGGGGLARLDITRAEAVAMGAEDRVVPEPAFDLAAYKVQATAQLEASRDAVLYATFTDASGITWAVRSKDRDLIGQQLGLLTAGLGATDFFWTDAAGTRQEMTAETFRALCVSLAAWTDNVFTAAAVTAGAISVAATRAEVDAAREGVEWPTS